MDTKLYPDLGAAGMDEEEDDLLADLDLKALKSKRPRRPPPPARAQSMPTSLHDHPPVPPPGPPAAPDASLQVRTYS